MNRLRWVGRLEGISLLLLLFVAVPLKHAYGNPAAVKMLGPIHGALFVWFVLQTLGVAVERRWKFSETTWKVLVACLVPFGTFYVDRTILSKMEE